MYPFRLATTSYIYKAGWAANVEKLAPCMDEIELVFFESRPDALPDIQEIKALRHLAKQHGCRSCIIWHDRHNGTHAF